MASSDKSKKGRTKPPKGRPVSTSAISHPAVEDTSNLTELSSFSPEGNYFAFISLAVDRHRLRVYDTVSGQSVAEHIVESARVSALTWGTFDPSEGQAPTQDDAEGSPNKKKRKKRTSKAAEEGVQSKGIAVVILGLSDGTTLFFSPTHGRVVRTLSHPTSTAAILSVIVVSQRDHSSTIWTSGADGAIRSWNAQKNNVLGSWKNDDRIPYSSMAVCTADQDDRLNILVAHHGIHLLSTTSSATDFDTQKPKQIASFTGHASSIKQLQWANSTTQSQRFLSMAEADRFVYIWEVPEGASIEGKPIASIPLDSDARAFSLSTPRPSSTTGKQNLLTLSASGNISVFPIPTELVPPASSNHTQHKIPTLLPRSTLAASSKSTTKDARIIDASFASGNEGHIRVARLVGGIRPVFDVVPFLNDSGEFIQEVVIGDVSALNAEDTQIGAPNKRYTESSSLAVSSGIQLGQDEEMDDLALRDVDGDLDVDLAEMSLGQRLTALSGGADARPNDSDGDEDEAAPKPTKSSTRRKPEEVPAVPANSLTRTLIQALHSSDSRLLETCLAHSEPTLIRNTVRRLPPQLAVPLISACVERLGRGARAGNMKGGGGGASSQRGAGLITWVKTVLAVHSGHLMTIPDLVARLSGLHATLTARLALQNSLLSLSGRLDMVLSQIEMRSSVAPAPLAPKKGKKPTAAQTKVNRYVEGESEDSEDEDRMDVEVEVGSGDEGSIEDIELGGDSEDEDESGEDEDEESEGEDYSDGEPTVNGFIDIEAEEEYSDEDDEESE